MSRKKLQDRKRRRRHEANRKEKMRRSKRRHQRKSPKADRLSFFKWEMPFASLPELDFLKKFQEIGREWAVQYDDELPKFEALIKQANPLALLAMASAVTLLRPADAEHDFSDEGKYFLSHLELLHAFVLRQQSDAFAPKFVESPHLQAVMDGMRTLARAFAFKRIAAVSPETSKEERGTMMVSEQFRVHTQDVRNDGYAEQMRRLYKELLAPLDADFRDFLGLSAQNIVECFSRVHSVLENRFNDYMRKCEPALHAKTPVDAVDAYARAYELESSDLLRLAAFIHHNKLSGDELRYFLIWQTLNHIHRLYIWSVDDWLPLLGPDATRDAAQVLVDCLSLQIGDLADANPDHFFMANPVWVQPLITIDESRFFLPSPGALLSHCLEIISSLIAGNESLKTKYLDRRGKFLESKLYEVVRRALPSADLFPGSLWQSADGTEGENDLLAVVNGIGLVLEAKAGTVHPTAKRGAPLRLQDTVDKLVVDASDQAHGFIDFLKSAGGPLQLPSSQGGVNNIDPQQIDVYIPIAISLDQLASELMCWRMLVKTKTIPPDAKPIVATSIWDFELVAEILDDEYLLLHYLARRYAVEQRVLYFGDELDLLVLYLDTAFDVPPESADSPLQIGNLSPKLHPYFIGKEQGLQIAKPVRQLTPWWRNLVAAIWKKQTSESREAAFALLDVAISQQEKIEKEFDRVKGFVRSNTKGSSIQDCIVFETGVGPNRYCVVLMALGDGRFLAAKEELNDYMSGTARKALQISPAAYAMVFAVHVDLKDLPYSRFILIHRDAWDASGKSADERAQK